MFKRILTYSLALLSHSQLHSHDPKVPLIEFDRQSAIAYALERNVDLRAAKLAIDQAQARFDQTGRLSNPRLDLDYLSDDTFNNEGERSIAISISQRFPITKRLAKAKEVSRIDIAKAEVEIAAKKREIANAISETALEIQLIDTHYQLLRQLKEKAQEIANFTTASVERGELSSLEANQAQLELRSLDQELHHLSHEREDLVRSLSPLLGFTADKNFAFAQSPRIAIESELAGFDRNLLERHPEFLRALLDTHSAEAEITLAKTQNWEDITARLFWKNERSVDDPNGLGTDRFLGVGVSIPLPIRKKGNLLAKEKSINRDRHRLESFAIEVRIHSEVENAKRETLHLKDLLERYQSEVIDLAEEQLALTQEAHQNGQLGLIDLLRSQEQNLRLERGYFETLSAYAHARLELEIARVDLPHLNPTKSK